jgi:hypothetical protein
MISYYSNAAIYYKNIGKKLPVSLPSASQIKPAE